MWVIQTLLLESTGEDFLSASRVTYRQALLVILPLGMLLKLIEKKSEMFKLMHHFTKKEERLMVCE